MASREMVTYKLEVFIKGVKVWERESFSPIEDIQLKLRSEKD